MKKLFLLLLFTCGASAFASGLPTSPYIYVQGSAETRVEPDTLTVSFGVSVTDPDQARAKNSVTAKSGAVFKLLDTLGIEEDSITAADISIHENFEYINNRRTSAGFVVSRNFTVRLTDFTIYPTLVNALSELRIESLSPAQASFSKTSEVSAKLKNEALREARRQAEEIAAGMDAKVTGVFAVSPIAFGEIPGIIFGGGGMNPMEKNFMVAARADSAGDKYIFDRISLSQRLHVIFLIEPARQ